MSGKRSIAGTTRVEPLDQRVERLPRPRVGKEGADTFQVALEVGRDLHGPRGARSPGPLDLVFRENLPRRCDATIAHILQSANCFLEKREVDMLPLQAVVMVQACFH
jgi:hypothetical protein